MVAEKSYHRSFSQPSLLSEVSDGSENIDSEVVIDTALDMVEDVAEKKRDDTASINTATVQGIMKIFEVVIESLENGTPSLEDEALWFPSFRRFIGKVIDDCREAFNWNDFVYSLTFGFLPTAWDVYTDISLGLKRTYTRLACAGCLSASHQCSSP